MACAALVNPHQSIAVMVKGGDAKNAGYQFMAVKNDLAERPA